MANQKRNRKRGKSFQNTQEDKRIEARGRKSDDARNGRGRTADYGDDTHNDPKWYNKFPEMVSVAANLSWNVSLGAPISIDPITSNNAFKSNVPTKDVGLYAVGFIPTYGVGDNLSDPLNKCVLEVYNQLRFNKSGSVGYNPADVGKMLMSMDSVYTFIAWLVRTYGYLNLASSVNRYIPRELVKTAGFDYDDLLVHKADLCFFINSMIIQAAKINVPKDLTITDRHVFLASNVFKDEPIERSSMFMFVPEFIWKYDEVNSRLIVQDCLHNHDTAATRWKFDDIVTVGKDLLNAVQQCEDFYTMNANILAAYGYENLHTMSPIDPLYVTIPVYREEMLIQLHNATMMGRYWDSTKMYVTEDMQEGSATLGALKFKPDFTVDDPSAVYEQLLDIPFDKPSTDDIMEATRFKVCCTGAPSSTAGKVVATLNSCGSEILTSMRAQAYGYVGTNYGVTTTTLYVNGDISNDNYTRYMTKLNMAPMKFEFEYANGAWTPKYVQGDITNFAVVEDDNLRNLHEAALYSELAVSRGNLIRI